MHNNQKNEIKKLQEKNVEELNFRNIESGYFIGQILKCNEYKIFCIFVDERIQMINREFVKQVVNTRLNGKLI